MRARSVLPILVLSLVLPSADPARAETDAANGGTIRVSANYHPGGANDAERRAIAETHDLVVLGTGFGDVGPPAIYYQVNPSIVAIEYQSWFDTGAGSIDWAELNQHEDWFYHDAQGRRIATYETQGQPGCDINRCPADPAYCSCRFGMNVGNPDYRAFVATRLTDLVTGGGAWGGSRGFDGIYLDNTFPSHPYRSAKVSSGFVTATPVLADGRTQTEADWVADQKGFLAAMKTAVGAKQLVFNGCQASANYPTWQPNSYSYLEHADGCSLEDWVVTGSGTAATPKTGSAWSVDVDLYVGVNDRGKWSTPLIGSGVHEAGVNRYGIATSLLTWSGPRSTFNFWKGTALEAIAGRFHTTFPEASIDLGSPLERIVTLTNGVKSRNFSAGRVLVNPTTATQTVVLDEPMTTVEGVQVTSVTLASGRAEILTKPASGNLPPADVRNLRRTDTR